MAPRSNRGGLTGDEPRGNQPQPRTKDELWRIANNKDEYGGETSKEVSFKAMAMFFDINQKEYTMMEFWVWRELLGRVR